MGGGPHLLLAEVHEVGAVGLELDAHQDLVTLVVEQSNGAMGRAVEAPAW